MSSRPNTASVVERERQDEQQAQHGERRHGQPVEGQHAVGIVACEDPEEQQRGREHRRGRRCESVGRVVVWHVCSRRAARIADERGHVNLEAVEVVEVGAPAPGGEDGDEGHAVGQREGQAKGIELGLDGRVAVHCVGGRWEERIVEKW
jgi:hypothetical protein